jgi:hypothetical protein
LRIGEMHAGFLWGNLREGDRKEEQGVDGRIILKIIFGKWMEVMDWIDLAQDRERWRAIANTVMDLQVA